jgi:hypothetical protein
MLTFHKGNLRENLAHFTKIGLLIVDYHYSSSVLWREYLNAINIVGIWIIDLGRSISAFSLLYKIDVIRKENVYLHLKLCLQEAPRSGD